MILVPSDICTFLPLVSIKPPLPEVRALASMVPEIFAVPPLALIATVPVRSSKVCASIIPVVLTVDLSKECAALAVRYIAPPSAFMIPLFSTIASKVDLSIAISTKEFPLRLSVILSPLAR